MLCLGSFVRDVESSRICLKCMINWLTQRNFSRTNQDLKQRYTSVSFAEIDATDFKTSKIKYSVKTEGKQLTEKRFRASHATGMCVRANKPHSVTKSPILASPFNYEKNSKEQKQLKYLSRHQNQLLRNEFHTSSVSFVDESDKNNDEGGKETSAVKDDSEIQDSPTTSSELLIETSAESNDKKKQPRRKTHKKTSKQKIQNEISEGVLETINPENLVNDDSNQSLSLDNADSQEGLVETISSKTSQKAVKDTVKNINETFHETFDGPAQMKEFLKDHGMETIQGHTCYVTACPKLGKPKKKQKNEGERLFINSTSGHFLCEHCSKSGIWSHLKDNITALRTVKRKKEYECFKNISLQGELTDTPAEVASALESALDLSLLSQQKFEKLLNVLEWQGITQNTLVRYGAKFIEAGNSYTILLPIKSFRGVVVGVRKFAATQKQTEEEEEPHYSVRASSIPRNLMEPFGWQSADPKSTSIVITGSEVESLAITQKTEISSIALKNASQLPQELLPYLEQFRKIIMWFGNDVKAWQSSKQFAKKLNDLRCHVFRPSQDQPSPLEAIRSGTSLKQLLLQARPIGHDSIVSFNKLRQEVYIELAQIEQVAGVKWKRYSPLNKIMKGHRPGELTVLTGPTGSGKTTFLADYSLDLCTQGVNTLWGSFEISNVRLAKVMLSQFAGKNMTKNIKSFDEVADLFAELPMFFMTFFGQEHVDKVTEAMSHAVYAHDIQHVIVDNLQFMMGMNYSAGSRFHEQDRVIAMFRRFATKMNCHVTLIIHPRKENDGEELMMASIFGSAKAIQEADNVLILQDMRLTASSGRKYIQVMKNRFDGELGIMLLKFDKDSLRFVPTQKKSPSQKKDEQEENAEDKLIKALKPDENQTVTFKKLDESKHSFENIMDIDQYYK